MKIHVVKRIYDSVIRIGPKPSITTRQRHLLDGILFYHRIWARTRYAASDAVACF